jgi:hypothetical protein
MKQDEDIWPYQDDAAVVLEYWKKRCLAAEKFIDESPCDPDIYKEQLEAYNIW